MHYLMIAGHQLMAWALGLALTVAFLDLGPGFSRDHPPVERRAAGALAGPLALLGLLCLFLSSPYWVCVLIAAPFAGMAMAYSLAWLGGSRPINRRTLGWQTGALGAFALLVLMLTAGPTHWNGGIVMAAYAASAAVLGGLTFLLIQAFVADANDVMRSEAEPFGVPSQVIATGLGLTVLALFEVLSWVLTGHSAWMPAFGGWIVLSLVVPGVLMAAGHKLYPRLQRAIWVVALASALGGQAVIHIITMNYPGLIPPGIG